MDTFGKVYLVIVVVSLIAAIAGFWVLSRKGPRWAVLAVAVCVFLAGGLITPGLSRELVALAGLLKIIGFIGGILGLIDFFRRRPVRNNDAA